MSANRRAARLTRRFRQGLGAAVVLALSLGAVAGCARSPRGAAGATPTVPVSVPVEREVTDHADFTARVAAVDSVEVRAARLGLPRKVNFKEGARRQEGRHALRTRPAAVHGALEPGEGPGRAGRGELPRLHEADYQRYIKLPQGAVTQSELDKALAQRDVDLANIAADKAVVASAELNLRYTRVIAPVSGA